MIHTIVPVLNEEPNIAHLLTRLKQTLQPFAPYRVLFVDDGSTDGTVAVLKSSGAEIETISHPNNQGPGAAFRTGFRYILPGLQPQDLVLTLEGDGTSDLAVLPRMMSRIRNEDDDIVLASCYLFGGGIKGTGFHRVGLSHIANGLVKQTLGLSGLATLSSFFRIYQGRALLRFQARFGDRLFESNGFESQIEILHLAATLGMRVSEVPMVLDGSRRLGKSKMKILKTSIAYLRLIARYRS
ncbi:MAG: glycosyltransferase [Vicinamibacteria bacterium]|nr:glycosyltransferase [Vicinamibacteria bacterium]